MVASEVASEADGDRDGGPGRARAGQQARNLQCERCTMRYFACVFACFCDLCGEQKSSQVPDSYSFVFRIFMNNVSRFLVDFWVCLFVAI